MMAKFDLVGGKNALRLRFSEGEKLEMHGHEPHTFHDIEVVSGVVAVYGDGWHERLGGGEYLRLSDSQMTHEIMAIDGKAEVLNIYRMPMPSHAGRLAVGWFEIANDGA